MNKNKITKNGTNEAIRGVFFDIDGTLIDPMTLRISDSTIDAIRSLQKHGIKVAIATVRPLEFALTVERLNEIKWDGCVTCAGAAIYDQDKNCLKDARLNLRTQKKIFETAKRAGIPVFYVVNGRKRITDLDDTMNTVLERYGMYPILVKPWEKESADMITLACDDKKRIHELFGKIRGITLAEAGDLNTDLLVEGVDKATGADCLMKHWNNGGAYAAFGDSMGDEQMLRQAAIGAPMPWASSKVRALGNMKMQNHRENTIANALVSMGLI